MKKIRVYGNIIITVCVILEIIIWPSINNFFGCLMTIISWFIFSKLGLNVQIIKEHTFAWLVFVSMSLYRILPLIATLLEGHSIGYNFMVPLSTYAGETFLYIISAIAFYLAINCNNSLTFLKKILFHLDFYGRTNNKVLWAMGFFGLILKVYVTINYIEYGDVLGKIMHGFTFFQYAPILIFFPCLIGDNKCSKVFAINISCLFYMIILIILSFGTNQRVEMLEPIITFILLFFLSYINSSKSTRKSINKKIVLSGIILLIFILPIINDISLAMLYNRQFKTNINNTEIFVKTFKTLGDRKLMDQLRHLKEIKEIKAVNTETNTIWSETYVSNFALNRFCNLKVTDNTLYHAKKVGFPNQVIIDAFWLDVVAVFPTPIIKFFGVNYNKNDGYSRGDRLKALSFNKHPFFSLLVTSHLADGLLVFGYWYFPIEFLLFFVRFLFLDTFLLKYKGEIYYSIFGLITIFSFFAMFRNAGGGCDSIGYLLRWYWQDVILFIIGFSLFKKVTSKI